HPEVLLPVRQEIAKAMTMNTMTSDPVDAGLSIFDELIERRASNSIKWAYAHKMLAPDEAAAEPLPMWVADMDFRAPQVVRDALHEAVDYGVFGYPFGATQSYLDAVVGWQGRRFGWEI